MSAGSARAHAAWPTIVIVGRPNVGKSTLFNRITGTRRSIVGDEPGITRDRIYGRGEYFGKQFELVDTGGMLPGEQAEIPSRIVSQAWVAMQSASYIIMVVDGRAELTAADQELAQLLWKTGKPVALAVNKIDTPMLESRAAEFSRLGFQKVFPISAEHNYGLDDLMDCVTASIAEGTEQVECAENEIAVAIIGRPNVGKSTLLNALVGDYRSIVSAVPGTTRDAVDTVFDFTDKNGTTRFRLVDTAGIRRKGKTHLMAEKLSVIMARRHIRLCDVALLVIDATEGITASDATIAGYAYEEGKSLIILVNKWDTVENPKEASLSMLNDARWKLKFLEFAPRLFVSGKSGLGVRKILSEARKANEGRRMRVPTGELNKFLQTVDLGRATSPGSKRPKIYYMTQSTLAPPRFVIFTDRRERLHFSFERFLVNQLRQKYGFYATPIAIQQRLHHDR
jgi:GTP-binding protein